MWLVVTRLIIRLVVVRLLVFLPVILFLGTVLLFRLRFPRLSYRLLRLVLRVLLVLNSWRARASHKCPGPSPFSSSGHPSDVLVVGREEKHHNLTFEVSDAASLTLREGLTAPCKAPTLAVGLSDDHLTNTG